MVVRECAQPGGGQAGGGDVVVKSLVEGSTILVLCRVDEGFEKALDLAIEHIGKRKAKFYAAK